MAATPHSPAETSRRFARRLHWRYALFTLGVVLFVGVLALLAADFDERDPAVKALISRAIAACRATGKYIGICGQGPSDHPDFADWLAAEGIASISLNPDSVVETWTRLAGR